MKRNLTPLVLLLFMIATLTATATPLSIYNVQYTTDISGDSPYADQIIDCTGGIVINKWVGGSTKLTIYDPANPNGWGGIIVKAFDSSFNSIQIGDEISFTGVLVEERSGNTQLTFDTEDYTPAFTVESTGNAITTGAIVSDPTFSEKYESMRLIINDPQIIQMNTGRYGDNYILQNTNGSYHTGDYMNIDAAGYYHSAVSMGASFQSVSGILEHKISSGWDYYQMLTTETADFVIPEPATIIALSLGGLIMKIRRKK